jgi:hypothetical protein
MPFEFGSGNRYQAYQTRPTWNTGKMPAHTTAKIVMASAARLIDVRHFWRSRHRMAEISVPAWPMPIQKTKLTMSHAQLTGLVAPDADARRHEVGDAGDGERGDEAGDAEAPPPPRGRLALDDAADLVGDPAEARGGSRPAPAAAGPPA